MILSKRFFYSLLIIFLVLGICLSSFGAQVDPYDTGPGDGGSNNAQTGQSQSTNTNNTNADPYDTGDSGNTTASTQSDTTDIPKKYIKFSGDFFGDISMGMHEPNEFYRKAARLRLQAEARFLSVQFYGQIEINYDTLRDYAYLNGQELSDFQKYFRLREVWAEYESTSNDRKWFTRFGLKIGRVIYSWGKGDEFRPSDILNPQDYTNFSFNTLNDRKIPIWSMDVQFRVHEHWAFNFIFIPVHRGSEIPGPGSPWENPGLSTLKDYGVTTIVFDEHEKKLSNSNYAVKTNFKLLDVDFSLGYYSGYDTMPTVDYIVPPDASMDYKYIRMLSFDFEWTMFGFGWRGEVAYYHQGKYFKQSAPTSPPSNVIQRKFMSWIFGFDKFDLGTKGFYINIQVIGEHILKYDGNNIQAKEHTLGVTWNLQYEGFNGKWKFELGGIYIFSYKELMLKPRITWRPQNDFNIVFGAIILHGKNGNEYLQGKFGYFYYRDFFFIQTNYSF